MDILHAIFSNTIIAFIILISVVVFVHELGHFLAGKAFGIEVEEFSIGFGPKAYSFKKGATEYRINWLPLGGYVRFYGSDIEQNIPPENREKSFLYAKLHKRAIVSLAGPLANFILSLFVMTFISILGVPYNPTIVQVLPNSIAEKSGIQTGDKIIAIDGKKIDNWSDLTAKINASAEKKLHIEVESQGIQKTIPLIPVKEEVETPLGNKQVAGRIGITAVFNSSKIVTLPDSFFTLFGLQTGDQITKINNNNILFLYQVHHIFEKETNSNSPYELANNILNNNLSDKVIQIEYQRNTEKKSLTINFNTQMTIKWANNIITNKKEFDKTSWRFNLLSSDQTISGFLPTTTKEDKKSVAQTAWQDCGIKSGQTIVSIEGQGKITTFLQILMWLDTARKNLPIENNINKNISMIVIEKTGQLVTLNCKIPLRLGYDHLNRSQLFLDFPIKFTSESVTHPYQVAKAATLFDAVEKGFQEVLKQIQMTYHAIKLLFTGSIPLSNLGGPIAIAGVAGEAAKGGLIIFLMTMAFISTNIGIMNLLPLPALDGGHLFLNAVEAAYGKALPKNVQVTVQRIGVLILLTLFVIVFYNDILRFIRLN